MKTMSSAKQSGQILIYTLGMLAILMVAVTAILTMSSITVSQTTRSVKLTTARHIAEAGLERAFVELSEDADWTGISDIALGEGEYTITATDVIPGIPTRKLIQARGEIGDYVETIEVIVENNSMGSEVGFQFAAQIGEGGIAMNNNSIITGNVYSNGQIIGATNTAISGSVVSAGPNGLVKNFKQLGIAGHVNAHDIENITVAGNVGATNCKTSVISGNLTAATKTNCTVTGTWTQQAATDQPLLDYPISDQTITGWKAAATAGQAFGSLNLTNGTTMSLGPAKITGDLTVDNNAILTLTGIVWVTGNINISNNAIVKLDQSFGANSGIIISDGYFDLNNNGDVRGSGTPGSYLMTLVLASGGGPNDSAIKFANNANGAIAYAPNGMVYFANNVTLKSVTANELFLSNNSHLTYDSGLASLNFLTTPGTGSWEIETGSWHRIPSQ